jgi:hypothetical protein
VDSSDFPGTENLDSLRDLLAGLGGALGSGGLLGWAGPGDLGDVPGQVFEVVRDAGLLETGVPPQLGRVPGYRGRVPGYRGGVPGDLASVPADADELMSLLWEIDEPEAIGLLTSLGGSGGPSRPRRRRLRRLDQDDPEDIFAEVARLTGAGTRWWTNTDLTRWNPVTQHTFDAVVVGAGNGIIVTLIAFEGGS